MRTVLALVLLPVCSAVAQTPLNRTLDAIALDSVTWRPAGRGLEAAVIDGNPAVADAPYTMLLRLAPDSWIPPHTHNVAKRILVLRGTLLVGHGSVLDSTAVTPMAQGGFVLVPAEHAHYEGARGETVVALFGLGPLRTTFVTAAP